MIIVQSKLEKITSQITAWLKFAIVSPVLFLIGSISLYTIFHTEIPIVFYFSWALFISVSMGWWFWLIKTIIDMIEIFNEILKIVKEIKNEVNEVYVELHNTDIGRKT